MLRRGHVFGQSREIFGVRRQRNVDSDRVMDAGVIARLHADPGFTAQGTLTMAEPGQFRAGNAAGNAAGKASPGMGSQFAAAPAE